MCVIGNGVVIDPQALFAEIDELGAAGIHIGGRLRRQRQGAPHPAVSPRARPAGRSAPRRAQDRHDVARHRPGLRRQDRAARHPRRRSGRTRPSLAEAVRAQRRRAQPAGRRLDDGLASRCSSDLRAAWRADAPLGAPTCRCFSNRRVGPGKRNHVRGRAGHAARHRSRHLSVRDVVERHDRRRCTGLASARARSTRCSAWPRPTRRAWAKARCHRVDRRDGRSPARERAGVRRRDGPAAPLRLVRRGRGALRRAESTASTRSRSPSSMCSTACPSCRYARRTAAAAHVLTEMPGDLAQLAACEPVYETLPGWTTPTARRAALRGSAARSARLRRPSREDHGRAGCNRVHGVQHEKTRSCARECRRRAGVARTGS